MQFIVYGWCFTYFLYYSNFRDDPNDRILFFKLLRNLSRGLVIRCCSFADFVRRLRGCYTTIDGAFTSAVHTAPTDPFPYSVRTHEGLGSICVSVSGTTFVSISTREGHEAVFYGHTCGGYIWYEEGEDDYCRSFPFCSITVPLLISQSNLLKINFDHSFTNLLTNGRRHITLNR